MPASDVAVRAALKMTRIPCHSMVLHVTRRMFVSCVAATLYEHWCRSLTRDSLGLWPAPWFQSKFRLLLPQVLV